MCNNHYITSFCESFTDLASGSCDDLVATGGSLPDSYTGDNCKDDVEFHCVGGAPDWRTVHGQCLRHMCLVFDCSL